MIEPFHEPDRAVAYLCDAMRGHGADSMVWVASYLKGHRRARTHVTECAHMVPILERFCDRFSEAIVIYGLRYGPCAVGGIQCRCYAKLKKVCPHQCQNHKERPLVIVVAFKDDLDITEEGRTAVLDLVEQEIEDHAGHHENRIGRHGQGSSVRRR